MTSLDSDVKQMKKMSSIAQMDDYEKVKKVALKSKANLIGAVDFRSTHGDTSAVLSNLNELHKKKIEDMGLLEFYKSKGMRTSIYSKNKNRSIISSAASNTQNTDGALLEMDKQEMIPIRESIARAKQKSSCRVRVETEPFSPINGQPEKRSASV